MASSDLFKLGQMGTFGAPVHMIGVLSWLVHWAGRAGTRVFCPTLVSPVQYLILLTAHFFTVLFPIAQQPGSPVCVPLVRLVGRVAFLLHLNRTLFHFICPDRPASWAGSRAASPVS